MAASQTLNGDIYRPDKMEMEIKFPFTSIVSNSSLHCKLLVAFTACVNKTHVELIPRLRRGDEHLGALTEETGLSD